MLFAAFLALSAPPSTPEGLAQCVEPLVPDAGRLAAPGSHFRYEVEMLGFDLGTVTIEVARRGTFGGRPVTEYRASLRGEPLVKRLLGVDGELRSLVPDDGFTPLQSSLRYSFRDERYHELQSHSEDGRVSAKRTRNGKTKLYERDFGAPVLDMLSAFNLMQRLPAAAAGCAVLYTDGRAYTIWLEPKGTEAVEAGGRKIKAERYLARYGSDKGPPVIQELDLWLSPGQHVIIRAESHAKLAPVFALAG
jgi:hypothetical protein